MESIGLLTEVRQYPVKSFQGVSLQQVFIDRYGVYGDRSHAFSDEERAGTFLYGSQVPQAFMEYRAEFISQERPLSGFPAIKITSPAGKTYAWNEPALLEELESLAERRLIPLQYDPHDAQLAVDDEPVHIIASASVKELERQWGKSLNPLRFRHNLMLHLDQSRPFAENMWIGKRIQVGNVLLEVTKKCVRCRMITVDPHDFTVDPSLLKWLGQEHEVCFGVYAKVIQTGEVKLGDEVFLPS